MSSYLLSDLHLAHAGLWKMTTETGQRLRAYAESADEGDELLIAACARTLHARDTVYLLGDIAISRRGLQLLARIPGRKILIRGNHDVFKLKDYTPWFADIRGTHKIDRMILSHYAIHPDSLPAWCHGNVHGHTHEKTVTCLDASGARIEDPRFLNVCVERIGLAPLPVEVVAATMAERHAAWKDMVARRRALAGRFTQDQLDRFVARLPEEDLVALLLEGEEFQATGSLGDGLLRQTVRTWLDEIGLDEISGTPWLARILAAGHRRRSIALFARS